MPDAFILVAYLAGFVLGALFGVWICCPKIRKGTVPRFKEVIRSITGGGGGPGPDR